MDPRGLADAPFGRVDVVLDPRTVLALSLQQAGGVFRAVGSITQGA